MTKWEGPRLALVLLAIMLLAAGLFVADALAPQTLGPFVFAIFGLLLVLARHGFGEIWRQTWESLAGPGTGAAPAAAGRLFASFCGIVALFTGLINVAIQLVD